MLSSAALFGDEAGPLQVSHVFGDGLLRHLMRLGKLVHRRRPAHQAIEDHPARGVRKGRESGAESIHNHIVVYLGGKVKPQNMKNVQRCRCKTGSRRLAISPRSRDAACSWATAAYSTITRGASCTTRSSGDGSHAGWNGRASGGPS